MRRMTVADVEELLVADDERLPERLTQIMDWHFERAMTSIRLSFGAAASLLAALLAALFENHTHLKVWEGVVIGVGIAAATGFGVFRLTQTKDVHADYVAALQLLREMAPLTPLLRIAREVDDG
jgi:hypothetical protein